MALITLSVQNINKGYRFYISKSDSKKYFKKRYTSVALHLNNVCIETKTTCGNTSKGFDLYSYEISEWIKANMNINWEKGNPPFMAFEYKIIDNLIHLYKI